MVLTKAPISGNPDLVQMSARVLVIVEQEADRMHRLQVLLVGHKSLSVDPKLGTCRAPIKKTSA